MKYDLSTSEHLRQTEKKTFTLHLISQVFNGLAIGTIQLQDVILKKSLGGNDFQIMLLSLLVSSAFMFSVYGTEIVNRSAKRSKTIFRIGFICKSFLILIPLFNNPVFYIFCISASAYFDSFLLSSWNIVFKHNYTEERRSKLYSYAASVQTVFILISTTLIGRLLDLNNSLYKLFFPVSGVFGIAVYLSLAKMIKFSLDETEPKEPIYTGRMNLKLLKDIIILPVRDMLRLFQENRKFLKFEINFFVYGMAFMITIPVVPIYLVDYLHLSYTPISIAKGFVFHGALILFTPLMGKHHGTGNPSKFCGYIFLLLALYPFTLWAANYINATGLSFDNSYSVYISYFLFGVAMSGVAIAWSLSSIYFAPPAQVANYQSAHITLTGVRGLFMPFLGYLIMKLFNIELVFIISGCLFLFSGVMMLTDIKKDKQVNNL